MEWKNDTSNIERVAVLDGITKDQSKFKRRLKEGSTRMENIGKLNTYLP